MWNLGQYASGCETWVHRRGDAIAQSQGGRPLNPSYPDIFAGQQQLAG